MTETAGLSADEAAAAARAAEQARLRKERREAKIKAGGNARLNRITGLGGGVQRDPIPIPSNPPSAAPSPAPAPAAKPDADAEQQHGDPDEVDISEHYYEPRKTNRIPLPSPAARGSGSPNNMSEDQLRQMMLGFDRPATPGANGNAPANFFDPAAIFGSANGEEDPMMKMLSQMLGGMPLNMNQGAGPGGPGSNPFGGGNPMVGGMQQQQRAAADFDPYSAFWRVVHFVVAAGLGLYMSLLAGFTGTKIERERAEFAASTGHADYDDGRKYFFWTFATAETILLTSRLLLDQGRAPPPGFLWTILGLIPDGKLKGLVTTGLKYSRIFTTLRSDILVCVFVLGVTSWLRT
ncbi:hypothetical protein DHEL01_v205362 [Diaporthe helianthi]|uniref:GET complex subunit GET2 n=1 Tax=Diaporthe helianthi TaxID=158607 RepID=A0A2P5I139_DIAHE|nr:hypothetical protein DHEL01_v205362 [Diaporthe helianthi]